MKSLTRFGTSPEIVYSAFSEDFIDTSKEVITFMIGHDKKTDNWYGTMVYRVI